MKAFSFARATDLADALRLAEDPGSKFIAGGTNLVDLMKANIELPERLIDISHLDLSQISVDSEGSLRLGALAKNTDTANHRTVREQYPLLTHAILSGASAQLRNAATNGGNLLQRTRCFYFYDVRMPCNKRQPGTGCPALDGFNRIHAILGSSDRCIATHPSDMCVALAALESEIEVEGHNGKRRINISDFHLQPRDTPHIDSSIQRSEIVTAIIIPKRSSDFASHSFYLKIRDRASYAFALVSVAAALVMKENRIIRARIALGGVASKPWRAYEAEALLTDRDGGIELFQLAAETALHGARPMEHNAFKIALAKRSIVHALTLAIQGTP